MANRLEHTGDGHYIFEVDVKGWHLCVEGELDDPTEMFISGAWPPGDDLLAKMFADIIEDSIESMLIFTDGYEIGGEVREMVLNAPVHEEVDNS